MNQIILGRDVFEDELAYGMEETREIGEKKAVDEENSEFISREHEAVSSPNTSNYPGVFTDSRARSSMTNIHEKFFSVRVKFSFK